MTTRASCLLSGTPDVSSSQMMSIHKAPDDSRRLRFRQGRRDGSSDDRVISVRP
jgi:hypothetical protein